MPKPQTVQLGRAKAQMAAQSKERAAIEQRLNDLCGTHSLRAYLDVVTIDCRPAPRQFRDVAEPWQWEIVEPMIPAIEQAAGIPQAAEYAGPRSFWLTLPRGSDKTSMAARLCNWLLGFSRRCINGVIAAADRDQAALLRRAMEREADLNAPWLKRRISFKRATISSTRHAVSPASQIDVITSDAPSSFGLIPDLVICDEVTQWRSQAIWDSLMSARIKRPDCVVIVLTNAGLQGSWQWDALQQAKQSDRWRVYEAPRMLASWMDAAEIAEARKLLTPALARRMFDNQWIDPTTDNEYLTRSQVEACERLGARLGLSFRSDGDSGVRYVAAVDYGPVKDRTVMVLMHRAGEVVVIDQMLVLQGSRDNHVSLAKVDGWLASVHKRFHRPVIVLDPYQLEATAQKFERQGCTVERFEPRGGKSNYELAENLRTLVINGRLAWYACCGSIELSDGKADTLVDEMASLVVQPMSYGYRINHTSAKHDDRCVAIGMGALKLVELPNRRRRARVW